MALVNEDLKAVNLLFEPVKREIGNIKKIIEKETNIMIKDLAEDYLYVLLKFEDVLNSENEKEMIGIRLSIIEDELENLKKRMPWLVSTPM
ncbi:MAG: hypothetical protein K2I03_00945 [Lachnospiraceae bacterium]|nr:hypothetical protein [Lachnospiraceae bacterium]MDE6252023.1 hypothetical protein [Lachnospiraceae bacterium]